MLTDTARGCMNDIGLSRENAERVASLLENGRNAEARQRLRALRSGLMDELHACQRKVDRLDWLIRETEKRTDGSPSEEGTK